VTMTTASRPDRTEAAEYYFTYIDQVPAGEICAILDRQLPDTLQTLGAISEERSLHRYAPGKWSIREVLGHVNDCERLFLMRAFWFARGFDTALPSFDQNVAVAAAGSAARTWRSHLDELGAIRASTLAFFNHLPADAWQRRGIASGNPFTVRALAYMVAGHLIHHVEILKARYL
jgi:uncharacterized damage-inducible protein DinB